MSWPFKSIEAYCVSSYGRITADIPREEATEERIMAAATGQTELAA